MFGMLKTFGNAPRDYALSTVILDYDESIMDGGHRVCKAILENRKEIPIIRFEKTPAPSYTESPMEPSSP